jgi:hypothetical protein
MRHPAVWIAVAVVAGLLVLSPAYGFHRDELYFIVAGRHPALGYPDQPALTPLLTAGAVWLLGMSPTAIRILPALAIGLCVLLAAAMAHDLGGSRRAQVVAAICLAASGFLAAGHLAATATYDILAWTVVLWLTIRLLAGADPRLWLAVGVAAGVGLENKHILLFLGAGLVLGLLLARRWDVIRSKWAWAGLGLAVLIWAPNLAWQAANGFPQLAMAAKIGGSDSRAMVLVQLILLAGPLLFVVAVFGALWLIRDPAARPWRAIGYAIPIVILLDLASGGKSYYAAGIFGPLMAAGGIRVDRWLSRGRPRLRTGVFAVVAVVSAAIVALLVLPVLPAATFAATPLNGIYKETGEQIGWPELAATVDNVVRQLPADQRNRAVVITDNYGQAAAIELLGDGSAPVYSGHNAYGEWGPPPDDRTTAVVVTQGDPTSPSPGRSQYWSVFGACRLAARIDNSVGLSNDEQGAGVYVCPSIAVPWSQGWPLIVHLD